MFLSRKTGSALILNIFNFQFFYTIRRYIIMKWGGYSNKAANKVTEAVSKVFGVRGLSILLSVVAFALLVGATHKWTF